MIWLRSNACVNRIPTPHRREMGVLDLWPIWVLGYGEEYNWLNPSKPSGRFICQKIQNWKQSTFCPHSALTCSQSLLEQTATCATYSINWLAFITETESVYSAVRTGALNIIEVNTILWRIKDDHVSFLLDLSIYKLSYAACISTAISLVFRLCLKADKSSCMWGFNNLRSAS